MSALFEKLFQMESKIIKLQFPTSRERNAQKAFKEVQLISSRRARGFASRAGGELGRAEGWGGVR